MRARRVCVYAIVHLGLYSKQPQKFLGTKHLKFLALAWLSVGVDSKRSTNLVFAHHYNPEPCLESG